MSDNPSTPTLLDFIQRLPKAELHLHIEGTLEPELIFQLAQRNGIALPYASIDALRAAYQFEDLQSFLDLYYAGASVLITENDFYDMTMAYMRRAQQDGIVHAEIMFDPQTHTQRGVSIQTVFSGIARALREMRNTAGISSYLILSFLRHLSEEEAQTTLTAALALREQYADLWLAIGLDSAERGNPPEKFARVYARCKELGFRLTAHAGEEGPASYVRDALDLLQVERVDHGVRSEEDPALMQRLINDAIPLTVCPLSNLKLCVVDDMQQHNLARMLQQGALVTVNSDDPAYFGGYVADNYLACAEYLNLGRKELAELARNSLLASFLPANEKDHHLELLAAMLDQADLPDDMQ
ncbi:adenosine deaminase [Pollutimonas harenae]|uniref:Adenine deaminase n=1 Tax=Pollutimonas harenae TaxID=657015 RepID=A0A853GWJ0_9BURK|nr:adenosine deaminase [Pollutimonas harenae]NYT86507.1 adenosine deaminase [Pollutimonas harenae]TEA69749.1 adenosine deaminase [Pollutimonas harenae]